MVCKNNKAEKKTCTFFGLIKWRPWRNSHSFKHSKQQVTPQKRPFSIYPDGLHPVNYPLHTQLTQFLTCLSVCNAGSQIEFKFNLNFSI